MRCKAQLKGDISSNSTCLAREISVSLKHPFSVTLQIALRASKDFGPIISDLWRAGQQTVRLVEALEPSALLEVHVGPRNTRYYQEVREFEHV